MNKLLASALGGAALAAASPAAATVTTADYTLSGSGGAAGLNGTITLAFDSGAGTYSLDALNLQVGGTLFDTSNATLSNFNGTMYELFGDLNGAGVFAATDDFFFFLTPGGPFPQDDTITFALTSNGGAQGTMTLAAAGPSGVPEPGTWAMMLLGFGAIGVAMRRRTSLATA